MSTIHVSASELKKNIATILNDVSFGGKTAIIERHGKKVAKIVPLNTDKKTDKDIDALLDKYYGIALDFPDVTKYRHSRKRTITL